MSETVRATGFRVAPPAEFDDELTRLTTAQPGRPYPLFESRQKLMMFAAALGFHRKRRQTEPFKRGSAIRLEVFQGALDVSFLDALAVVHANDLGLLAPEKGGDRTKIFEDYAYSGIREIVDVCLNAPGDSLQALVTLIEDLRKKGRSGSLAIDLDMLRSLGAE